LISAGLRWAREGGWLEGWLVNQYVVNQTLINYDSDAFGKGKKSILNPIILFGYAKYLILDNWK
jgi:hypothetical protein